MRKLTTDEFIKKATAKHGLKYDYSKAEYIGSHKKLEVICSDHGSFFIAPSNHYAGKGCAKCATVINKDRLRFSTENIITQFKEIHKDKYGYSKVEYVNIDAPVIITCRKHGDFMQTPAKHKLGRGCVKCHFEYNTFKRESYIKLSQEKNKRAKLYLIKCNSEDESFYKVGITLNSLEIRFDSHKLPYGYEVVQLVDGDTGLIYDMEKQIHSLLKNFKYHPLKPFKGDGECFTEVPRKILELLESFSALEQNQLIV
ncbi:MULTISPECIES: hypothetical protein [Acinetobacter]|uniref:hypothetical protein n=1 Tax=Acinetobacter TaxID=469 RepID=UPI000C40FC3F|nr:MULTISPECIES: hypothetical protein [Acinetobacter]MBC70431.1 hypothetical protein [Acinetobacter sp.]MBT51719.1 hypothetical protein [Acinetobacter sp.]HIQ36217.1 hypothetical protein [Acinetobacter venetianus]|tara:strand:+ start:1766 stop:2533 length:768 start_codon:yes stop_codon:yes gene_type:complete